MHLLSHRASDGERLAVVVGETVVDVADLLGDAPWTMARLLLDVDETLAWLRAALAAAGPSPAGRALGEIHALAPVPRPGKVIAIGRNYVDHAAEQGLTPPTEPTIFTKFGTSVVGDGADIEWRASDTAKVDFEAELAVVIGRRARDVPKEQALGYVLGYACLNDVSARDLQFADGQWIRGKSLDTFCPLGPWIVTADEITDPGALRIRCLVDGVPQQDASTADMVHGVADLIAYCSRFFTLEPGDVIATGTPGGVGVFRDPPVFLADGNEVVIEIEGIGFLRNRCRILPD